MEFFFSACGRWCNQCLAESPFAWNRSCGVRHFLRVCLSIRELYFPWHSCTVCANLQSKWYEGSSSLSRVVCVCVGTLDEGAHSGGLYYSLHPKFNSRFSPRFSLYQREHGLRSDEEVADDWMLSSRSRDYF